MEPKKFREALGGVFFLAFLAAMATCSAMAPLSLLVSIPLVILFVLRKNNKSFLLFCFVGLVGGGMLGSVIMGFLNATGVFDMNIITNYSELLGYGAIAEKGFFPAIKNAVITLTKVHGIIKMLITFIFAPIFWGLVPHIFWILAVATFPQSAEEKLQSRAGGRPQEPKTLYFNEFNWNNTGVPLGINLWIKSGRDRVFLPASELNKHVCLVGTTGSGKTTTLLNFIRSALTHKKALVFVDGKGETRMRDKFRQYCQALGMKSHVITIDGNGTIGYNPIGTGTPTEITDKLIGIFDWSEEHYKLGSTRFCQLLIQYMRLVGLPVHLGNIIKFADFKALQEFEATRQSRPSAAASGETGAADSAQAAGMSIDGPSIEAPAEPSAAVSSGSVAPAQSDEATELLGRIKTIDKQSISGFRDRLATLAESDMRATLEAPQALNLTAAIEAGEAVLFSLDSLRYPGQAKTLGRLVVNDLKTCVSVHAQAHAPKPVSLIFDEFNVFVSHEVIDVINKSRSAGFEAVLSFQSLSDIDKLDGGEALRRQIIQNCNSLIVQKQNDHHDAEELSTLFGTYEKMEMTVQELEMGGAGAGSLRMVHKFNVHPDEIKGLRTGQAFAKISNFGWFKLAIIPEGM